MRILVVILLILAPVTASADTWSNRFCIHPVVLPPGQENENLRDLKRVVPSSDRNNDIFFLGRFPGAPKGVALLRDGRFVPMRGPFPNWHNANNIHITPEGDVIGVGGKIGDNVFYKQNQDTGQFQSIQIEGPDRLKKVRSVGKSTPLDALVMTAEVRQRPNIVLPARVYAIRDNKAHKIEGMFGWVTKIVDLPELNMTFFATEYEQQMYIVDGTGQIHDLGALEFGKWIFIRVVIALPDPPRLLLDVEELLGPHASRHIIRLEQTEGVWHPSATQDLSDVRSQYTTPGKDGLKDVDVNLVRSLRGIAPRNRAYDDAPYLPEDDRTNALIRMPRSDAHLVLVAQGIHVLDARGARHTINTQMVEFARVPSHRDLYSIAATGDVLFTAVNGYFLIREAPPKPDGTCIQN